MFQFSSVKVVFPNFTSKSRSPFFVEFSTFMQNERSCYLHDGNNIAEKKEKRGKKESLDRAQ